MNARQKGQAGVPERRLQLLPLVPCHGARELADEETAAVLNEHFISVKVDREERPDIDSVYMSFCQAFTGSGGWPMSVFMTPDQRPFYAGTYFPPRPRYGMPGFAGLLRTIADRWAHGGKTPAHGGRGLGAAAARTERPRRAARGRNGPRPCPGGLRAVCADVRRGIAASAPRPSSRRPNLMFLLAYARFEQSPKARDMAVHTLEQMRRGGIFDHVGYFRYSTDREFLAPHFENALRQCASHARLYGGLRRDGNAAVLDTAEKTADYVLRELADAGGAFCSAPGRRQ